MSRRKKRQQEERAARESAGRESPEPGAAQAAPAPEETLDYWKDRALRLQAEIQNMRRRSEQDVEDRTRRRLEALFSELITLEDHLVLALESIPEALREDPAARNFLAGVQAIASALRSTLVRFGLEAIEPEEHHDFDPEVHEAVHTEEREELEAPRLELMRRGYRMGSRILRPAQVRVLRPGEARAPAGPAERPEEAGEGPKDSASRPDGEDLSGAGHGGGNGSSG